MHNYLAKTICIWLTLYIVLMKVLCDGQEFQGESSRSLFIWLQIIQPIRKLSVQKQQFLLNLKGQKGHHCLDVLLDNNSNAHFPYPLFIKIY